MAREYFICPLAIYRRRGGEQPAGSAWMIAYRRPDVIFFTKRAHAVHPLA